MGHLLNHQLHPSLQILHMRLLPLRAPRALEFVHGRSGPADQSGGSPAREAGRFVQLASKTLDHQQGHQMRWCTLGSLEGNLSTDTVGSLGMEFDELEGLSAAPILTEVRYELTRVIGYLE